MKTAILVPLAAVLTSSAAHASSDLSSLERAFPQEMRQLVDLPSGFTHYEDQIGLCDNRTRRPLAAVGASGRNYFGIVGILPRPTPVNVSPLRRIWLARQTRRDMATGCDIPPDLNLALDVAEATKTKRARCISLAKLL